MIELEQIESNQMEIIRRLIELKDLMTTPNGNMKENLKPQASPSAQSDNRNFKATLEAPPKNCPHTNTYRQSHRKWCADCGELLETIVGSGNSS